MLVLHTQLHCLGYKHYSPLPGFKKSKDELLDEELKRLMSELDPYSSMELELTALIGEQKVDTSLGPLLGLEDFCKRRLKEVAVGFCAASLSLLTLLVALCSSHISQDL